MQFLPTCVLLLNSGTYYTRIPSNTARGTVVFTCAATDRDTRAPFNTITYEMVLLDNTAGLYFNVQPDGDIVLTNSLLQDNLNQYQVHIVKYSCLVNDKAWVSAP